MQMQRQFLFLHFRGKMATPLSFSGSARSLALCKRRLNLNSFQYRTNIRIPSSGKCKLHDRTNLYCRKSKVFCSQVQLENNIDDEEACELVSGSELILGEGSDTIHAYLLKAVKNNNESGVLLLSDIFGFEDSSTREFAYRVACSGYNVLVPDLFCGNPWTKHQPLTQFEHWLEGLSAERITKDISTSSNWMFDEFVAAGISRKIGIIGFGFGGNLMIETLAHDDRTCFGTGVCFYGTGMNPSKAGAIKIPILFVSGDKDPFCSVDILHEMEKNIKGSTVKIYPGRGPNFAHRPESPEEDEDAEDAFVITRHWLHEKLVVNV